MRFLLAALLGLSQIAVGSILRLETVTLPLYLHGSETEAQIAFERVPVATSHADPEWRFSAISVPFVPPFQGTQRPSDVNLASLYRITVSGTYRENGKDVLVTVDASKAAQPEGYPFTTDQVLDAVVTCVKLMYPARPLEDGKLEIAIQRPGKRAETRKPEARK